MQFVWSTIYIVLCYCIEKKSNIHYIIHNNCWAASSVEPQRSWTILSVVAEITSSSSVSLTNQLTSLLPGIIFFLIRPSTFSLKVKFLVNCLGHFCFASEKTFLITKCYLTNCHWLLFLLEIKKYSSRHFFMLMLSENINKETVFPMKCY